MATSSEHHKSEQERAETVRLLQQMAAQGWQHIPQDPQEDSLKTIGKYRTAIVLLIGLVIVLIGGIAEQRLQLQTAQKNARDWEGTAEWSRDQYTARNRGPASGVTNIPYPTREK